MNVIHDWNLEVGSFKPKKVQFDDETLRDGLQSPSTVNPPIEGKIQLLRLMDHMGIDSADVGYPSASPIMFDDVTALVKTIKEENLQIAPNCAARTHPYDINPIIDISHALDYPIEVCAFLGSSPVRQLVEKWNMTKMQKLVTDAVNLCLDNDVPMMFVTEDTTRADPDDIKALYLTAVEAGAPAICIADTVGHAVPKGVHRLVTFVRQFLDDEGYKGVRIDWHGHRDRGLSVANSIAAIEAGANRIHGTALGIGERCGNTPMDQLLVNLKMLGWIDNDLSVVAEYVELASDLVKVPIPSNYPVIGKDAFRTATGVHAAAIMKAEKMGLDWANTVYSSVDASMVGKHQVVDVGPLSGMSNVYHKLNALKIEAEEEKAKLLLEYAKAVGRIITDEEIYRFMKTKPAVQPV